MCVCDAQADKVKKPLLLIHGEDDNNTGGSQYFTDYFADPLLC